MDPVNSPAHYKNGEVECIDAMVQVFGQEAVRQYALINHFKYLWRHRYKGHEMQDLDKADWYWQYAMGNDPRDQIEDDPIPVYNNITFVEEGRLV